MGSYTAVPRRRSLSTQTVLNVRKQFTLGTLSQRQIARRFRIAQSTVSRIGNYLQRANVRA
jgi:hypothetical protein